MRHHGWELPYHPLQVIAIAVFVSLAFAFYVFFIPFLGSKVLQYHVIALFSPLVVIVFALYIRCAAANPADPGLGKCSKEYTKGSSKSASSLKTDGATSRKSGGTPASTSGGQRPPASVQRPGSASSVQPQGPGSNPSVLCFPCYGAALCLRKIFGGGAKDRALTQDDLLYCSLCEAEIFRLSKHCRACDKCVDGFDHHCRWINNCIGKKNYKTFVALMVTSLLLLVLEWGVGIFVIVRCVLHRNEFEDDIVSKLGSSFSLIPFLVVVALCTVLAMMATFPLAQLFFFHVVLIHKGISTYDYIVAMRERDQLQDVSSQSSPISSATAVSGTSSVGILQRRPWCTPPRLLVEQQDTTVSFGADLEHGKEIVSMGSGKKDEPKKPQQQAKKAVKINPWKLARLNADEAAKASARARENSSVLRPINDPTVVTETDNSSPEDVRSPATEIVPVARKPKRKRDLTSPGMAKERPPTMKIARERKHEGSNGHRKPPPAPPPPATASDVDIAPLQLEAQGAFWPRTIVPAVSLLSPPDDPVVAGQRSRTTQSPSPPAAKPWLLQRSVSDGYEASGGESADDSEHGRRLAHAWSKLKQSSTFVSSSAQAAVLPIPKNALRYSGDALRQVKMGAIYAAAAGQSSSSSKKFPVVSTDEDCSSPSQYNSPDRESDFFSAGDHSVAAASLAAARHAEAAAEQLLRDLSSSRSGSARSMASLH